jgi:hypothetical protein
MIFPEYSKLYSLAIVGGLPTTYHPHSHLARSFLKNCWRDANNSPGTLTDAPSEPKIRKEP